MSIMDFFTKFKIVPFLKKNDTLKLNLISGFFDPQDTLKYYVNIPPPIRRGRTTLHFRILSVACCLHLSVSGSTFLIYPLTTQQFSLYATDC